MFANKVTFMQSVFSPSRPPLSVRYAHATSSKPAPPDFKKQEVVRSRNIAALGADVLEHVVAACWQSCERAPFCASVSKEFQHASVQAAKTLAAVDVVPHRPVMKVAGAPSLTPALSAEEDAAIKAWGEGMEDYAPRKGYKKCGKVEKNDMCRVLDVKKSGGWLTSSAVDTYMSTLMPGLIDADPGTERIFLQGFHSHQIEKYGTLGFDPEKSDDRDSAKVIRRRAAVAQHACRGVWPASGTRSARVAYLLVVVAYVLRG